MSRADLTPLLLHIRNIFKEGELDQRSVVKEDLTTASDGKRYKTKFYNNELIQRVNRESESIVLTLRSTILEKWRRLPVTSSMSW